MKRLKKTLPDDSFDIVDISFNLNMRQRRMIEKTVARQRKGINVFLRDAALIAVGYSNNMLSCIAIVDPREKISLERAIELGMNPLCEVGCAWKGDVRIPFNNEGYFKDRLGNIWGLEAQGLMMVCDFEQTSRVRT